MSITAMGRWALNVTCAIISSLGLEVIYGDTDSVMFTVPGMHTSPGVFAQEDRYRPIMIHIESISKEGQPIDSVHKCEYLSGSKGALAIADANNKYMYGMVPKIVNHIMSYTCLTQLKVEHQETGASTSTGIMSNVYESFVLLSKKHYTSRLFNGGMHDKGISYVRRTGSYLRNIAMRKFLAVLLETSDTTEIVAHIQNEYRSLSAAVKHGQRSLMVVRTTIELFVVPRESTGTVPLLHGSQGTIPAEKKNKKRLRRNKTKLASHTYLAKNSSSDSSSPTGR